MKLEELRRTMLERRRAVDAATVDQNSRSIATRLWQMREMRRCRSLAGYFSVGGEIDCHWIFSEAWSRQRAVFLPVLVRSSLSFAPYDETSALAANRFGIPEPIILRAAHVDARQLHVVLTPLVAFDESGARLGMGGGFYDRSLAFMRRRKSWRRPLLIGLAHEFQKSDTLAVRSWDVPLDAVVTEKRIYRF
jgi:5-formyltetrahydrofolate cyclo-ligase